MLKPQARCGANRAAAGVSVRECSRALWFQVAFEADVGASKDLACAVTHFNSNIFMCVHPTDLPKHPLTPPKGLPVKA